MTRHQIDPPEGPLVDLQVIDSSTDQVLPTRYSGSCALNHVAYPSLPHVASECKGLVTMALSVFFYLLLVCAGHALLNVHLRCTCDACCMCHQKMNLSFPVLPAHAKFISGCNTCLGLFSDCSLCHTDDAVQATKARIEALKKETPVPESPSKDSIPAKPPQTRPRASPSAPDTKGPKKLSDVKVSANIAASLGNIKLSPSAAPASNGSAARGPAAGATAMPAAATAMPTAPTAAPSHMDLLGGLDAPPPASMQHASGELAVGMVMHGLFANQSNIQSCTYQ